MGEEERKRLNEDSRELSCKTKEGEKKRKKKQAHAVNKRDENRSSNTMGEKLSRS